MINQKVVSQISIPVKCDLLLIVSIIRQESGFNPRAVSKAGAKGLMQIMPPTWGEWVRIIGIKAADPFNPLHNIMVGCAELNRQISNFEDLRLALTAYNWGSGNLRKFNQRLD
jgi:soluble lytic murein transglycosylase-like protein